LRAKSSMLAEIECEFALMCCWPLRHSKVHVHFICRSRCGLADLTRLESTFPAKDNIFSRTVNFWLRCTPLTTGAGLWFRRKTGRLRQNKLLLPRPCDSETKCGFGTPIAFFVFVFPTFTLDGLKGGTIMSELTDDRNDQACAHALGTTAAMRDELERETGTARRQELLKAIWRVIRQSLEAAAHVSANTPITPAQSNRIPSKRTESQNANSAASS
jgi:hypothetical protein